MMHLFSGNRGGRVLQLILAVVLCGTWTSTERVEAGLCAGGNPPLGVCALKVRDYPGEFPYAMTVIEGENTLVVSDLFSGQFFKFNRHDIELPAAPDALTCPVGPATYTGLAWVPGEGRLYWLIEGGLGPRLVISNSSGVFESEIPLTPPAGAFLSGLAFKPDTGNLWTSDIVNDEYLELSPTGVFTGLSFESPGKTPFGGEVFGLGVTAVPSDVTETVYQLEVTTGAPSDLRTARTERVVAPSGASYGLFYDLNADNNLSGWVTGLAWSNEGSSTTPSTFYADLTQNKIVELPSPFLPARSVIGLTCVASPQNDVTLNWSNTSVYNSITVLRDGAVISSLGGTATTFTDTDVEGGAHEYTIDPLSTVDLPAGSCEVVVGFGRFVNATAHVGTDGFAITVIENGIDQVLVADLNSGMAHLYSKSLVDTTIVVPSPFGTTSQTAGVAWNSSDSTLLWHNGAGQIQKTDLQGGLIGTMVNLTPMPLEPTGDISYAAVNGTYFGVSLTGLEYFEFQEDGTIVDSCAFPNVGGLPTGFGQGVTVVADSTSVILDVPLGPVSGLKADRVRRLLDCGDTGLEYLTTPTTLSGALAGIAWTPAGSTGIVAEYLVGFDTGSIYEVSLDLSSVGDDFQRGDVNTDGFRDISDATSVLVALFGGGTGTLACLDSADSNDDGTVNLADAVQMLNYLFVGGITLDAPFSCGGDPTIDSQSCDSYPICP